MLDGTYPTNADDTDNLTGVTGASITPDTKTYTGFTAPAKQTATIAADGSTVVIYKYTRNTYTVSFDVQGHGTAPANITAKYDSTISAPTAPTVVGYTFAGWYKESGCTNVWNFGTDKVTGNTTLYAKWTTNTHNVIFNSNGHGTAPSGYTNQAYGSKFNNPGTITGVTGYTHDGNWYTDSECKTA